MHLTPREIDKLVLHQAGFLAQKRLARGLRLNYPEAVALIATQLLEFIRDGRSVAELMDLGRQLLGRDGRRGRHSRDDRRGAGRGHVSRRHQARHGPPSDRRGARRPVAGALRQLPGGLGAPRSRRHRSPLEGPAGEVLTAAGELTLNADRDVARLEVANQRRPADSGRQPLSLHRNEPRARLRSRRGLRHAPRHSGGHRRALRAGRDEDGESRGDRRQSRDPRRQRLRERAGDGGDTGELRGPGSRRAAVDCDCDSRLARAPGFVKSAWELEAAALASSSADADPETAMAHQIKERHYADIYGPTTGDRVRLGDTGLVARSRAGRHGLRRRMQVRRRQGAARRHGPGGGRQRRTSPRLRHHQRADRRLDRHPQGRRRHQGRPHRRHRQGRQSRRDGRRHRRDDRRRDDRGDRRRRADPHGRRHRRAHPFHLSAAGLRGARQRRHHVHRRRHRPGHRHQRDDLHAGRAAHRADAAGDRRAADEFRLSRQGQHVASRRA